MGIFLLLKMSKVSQNSCFYYKWYGKKLFLYFKKIFCFPSIFSILCVLWLLFFKQWTELCSDKVLDTNNVAFRSFLVTLERFEVKFLSQRLPKWRFSGYLRIHQYPFVKHFFEDFLILLRHFQFYMSHDSVLFTNGRNYVWKIILDINSVLFGSFFETL